MAGTHEAGSESNALPPDDNGGCEKSAALNSSQWLIRRDPEEKLRQFPPLYGLDFLSDSDHAAGISLHGHLRDRNGRGGGDAA
jgi:hypothetical protein